MKKIIPFAVIMVIAFFSAVYYYAAGKDKEFTDVVFMTACVALPILLLAKEFKSKPPADL